MRRAAIVTLVVAVGCVKSPQHVAALPRWCWDSVEVRALACSDGTARRSGDTLYVRLANGRVMSFIEDFVSEAPGGYKYFGRIGRPALEVIQENGREAPPRWVFANEETGRSIVAEDEPVFSPDGARFATAAQPDWNNCTERDHPSLDVWRFTDTLPVLEWRLDPWDCRHHAGLGPTDPRWHGPDTLEFVRREEIVRDTAARSAPVVERRQSRALAVRDGNGWHLIAK
jgi:hypothetical protein